MLYLVEEIIILLFLDLFHLLLDLYWIIIKTVLLLKYYHTFLAAATAVTCLFLIVQWIPVTFKLPVIKSAVSW